MKRITILLIALGACLGMRAQLKDASAVYAEFSKFAEIIQTTSPDSAQYEIAQQTMLHLFPQLQYYAASYSQQNQPENALAFAKAYVDMPMMPQFKSMNLEASVPYPTMTYFVGSKYYNRQEYDKAVRYLQKYIDLDVSKNRAVVFLSLAKAYEKIGDTEGQLHTLEAALAEFPNNKDMLNMAVKLHMQKGWYAEALPLVERALQGNENSPKQLNDKGKCLEGLKRYEEAAEVFGRLAEQHKTLPVYQHYAVNLFNCAVSYYQTDRNTAVSYFNQAIPVLKQVVATDPSSVPFTTALAQSFLYTDQYSQLAEANIRLRAMGAPDVASVRNSPLQMMSSEMPQLASAPVSQFKPTEQAQPEQKEKQSKAAGAYRLFVQNYVEKEIALWQQKDPFETIDEYKERVTEQTRAQQIQALLQEAKNKYIAKQQKNVRISDFKLQPYDAENRVFLIRSPYGDIVLPVPRENNEARNLAATWKDVRVENPEFDIAEDEMVIRQADFVTKAGQTYHYSDMNEARYSQTEIAMQFSDIDYSGLGGSSEKRNKVQVQKNTVKVGNSDVDINIPEAKSTHPNRFAFLIGNENYQLVAPVPYALHDVRTMKQYCQKTLGIPATNIRVYEDATFGKMLACMREIKSISEAYNGNIDIIFYYAGHGVPDEANRSAFLLPVDADGVQKESCYAVGRLYQELGRLGANSVVVMMDACFSGSKREEGMLVSARGVAVRVRADAPQGKMVVFSAATGEETAYPYEEQQHGMFTYYLLKSLQDSKGRISLGDLTDYVKTQVKQRSVVINHKSQTPTVNASPDAADWRKWSWK